MNGLIRLIIGEWENAQKEIDRFEYDLRLSIACKVTHPMTSRLLEVAVYLYLDDDDLMESLDCGDTDLDNLRNNRDEVELEDVYRFCLYNPCASSDYILFGKGEPLI